MPEITIVPMNKGVIHLNGKPVTFDHCLFSEDKHAHLPNSHLESYSRMQEFLATTHLYEHIALYVTAPDANTLGAISGFLNFCPSQTKEISQASQRQLSIWIADSLEKNSRVYSFFQHFYSFDTETGMYYGRTISRMELTAIDQTSLSARVHSV